MSRLSTTHSKVWLCSDRNENRVVDLSWQVYPESTSTCFKFIVLLENNGYQLGNEIIEIQPLMQSTLKHLECISGYKVMSVMQYEQIRNNGAIWEEFITRRTWQRFQLQKQWNVAVLLFYTKEFHKCKQSVHLTEVLVKITLTTTKKTKQNKKHPIINIQVQLIWGQRNCDFLIYLFLSKYCRTDMI